jgi:hypothetical protein
MTTLKTAVDGFHSFNFPIYGRKLDVFLGVTNCAFEMKFKIWDILIYLNHNQITFLTGLSLGMEQKRVKSACPSRKRSL